MAFHTIILILAAFAAGAVNALAGGGTFLIFPALLYAGLDARAANITSTIALFPQQITTGLAGRAMVGGAAGLSFTTLFWISLTGGGFGAFLLLATPSGLFARLVPYLVLFATAVFAWGSFLRPAGGPAAVRLGPRVAMIIQCIIAIYGGYFGGGIGILMLAALTAAGQGMRAAGASKNVLAGVMNAAAVVIFLFEARIAWRFVLDVALAAVIGGQTGVYALKRVNETILRACVVITGIGLAIGLFIRAP
jgi:uncharacterized membrane protein YfcA